MFQHKKVIIFDMDGTLIDSVGIWNTVDSELIVQLGGEALPEINIQQRRDELLRSSAVGVRAPHGAWRCDGDWRSVPEDAAPARRDGHHDLAAGT